MSDFKITDKNGIKLKTANKYVMEDLTVTLTNEDFSNLVSENIRKGKTILNISGSLEEGIDTSDATAIPSDILVGKTAYAKNEKIEGTMSEYDGTFENGEDNSIEDGLITRTLTSYSNDRITSIGDNAFYKCSNLTSVNIPNATSIGYYAFQSCSKLIKLVITQTTKICTLGGSAFEMCYHFLGTTDSNYNPEGLKDGRIYVPDSLVDSYKSATNWSQFADIIVGLSELPAEE